MKWDDVRVLLAVSRSRSLQGASVELGVDKATVSRRATALEASLDARLFLRTREGLRLSPLGAQLEPHARAMEAAARGLASARAARATQVEGLVRLATTESLASRLVELGLLDLRAAWPGLELELLGGNRPVDLVAGEADLALRITRPEQRALKVRVAARLGVAMFASPDYLSRRGTPSTVTQLQGHDVLLPSGELSRLPEAQWLSGLPGVRAPFRSSSLGALVLAAKRGAGLLVLTRAWGDGEAGLKRVLALPQFPVRPVWLAATAEALERPAVRVVADRVAALIRVAAG
jgi:DNA-binding transcriptional LysR family regulator